MSPLESVLERAGDLSTSAKYTALNGIIYLAGGALLILWPGATQTLLMDKAFVGDESGLVRAVGTAVAVIGWLYLNGGLSGARRFVACTVFDRLILVPAVLIPLAVAGVFPHLFLAITLLDLALAIGAWLLVARQT